ncbi:MAG: potassium channel family protein [Gemmatimonadota bacterium]|nr:potassium channel family protein [Gemmatimonadota bacterium]
MTSSMADGDIATPRHRFRFTTLLVAIIALLLLSPVVAYLPLSGALFSFLGAAIPLAAIYAVSDNRRHLYVGLALGLPATFAGAINLLDLGFQFEWLALLLPPVFYAYTVWVVGRRVFTSPAVNADTLAGAACVYLLIGMTWWFLFLVLEVLQPGSFAGRPPGVEDPTARFDLLYFSFVTLTTLGYGDILPLTRAARALSIVLATVGVLYLGIVIARLVGVYAANVIQGES